MSRPNVPHGSGDDVLHAWVAENLSGTLEYGEYLSRLPLAVIATDPDGSCTWANPAWSELSGIPFEDALGIGWSRALHPEDKERVVAEWSAVALARGIYDGRYRFLRPDGTVRWVRGVSTHLFDRTGEISGHIGVVIDETPSVDLDRIAWMLTTGFEGGSRGLLPSAYGDLTRLNTDRTVLDGIGEELLRKIAGEYVDMLGTSSAIYEADGSYALGIFSSGWCLMMDAASRALCDTDDDAEALASGKWLCHESCWNECSRPAIESGAPVDIACNGGIRLYGMPIRSGDRIIGAINFGYGDPPTDEESLQQLAEKYHMSIKELRKAAYAHEKRPQFVVDLAKRKMETCALLIGEIVERRRVESALDYYRLHLEQIVEERTAQARAASEAKDDFLAGMSHELRTPLNSVIGFTDILRSGLAGPVNDEQHKQLEMMADAGRHLLSLVNDLLDLSRMEKGRMEVDAEEFDWTNLVVSAAEGLRTEAEAKGLTYSVGSEGCEYGRVVTDRTRVHQVILNLLSNALKFTDSGFIDVLSECSEDRVSVTVTDSGPGVSVEDIEAIFEDYYQVRSVDRGKPAGAGLGLALSRRVARLLGGDVTVTSEEGKGTSFTFWLARESA